MVFDWPDTPGERFQCEPDESCGAADRDDDELELECPGHQAGPNGPAGVTVYCDGSCLSPRAA